MIPIILTIRLSDYIKWINNKNKEEEESYIDFEYEDYFNSSYDLKDDFDNYIQENINDMIEIMYPYKMISFNTQFNFIPNDLLCHISILFKKSNSK